MCHIVFVVEKPPTSYKRLLGTDPFGAHLDYFRIAANPRVTALTITEKVILRFAIALFSPAVDFSIQPAGSNRHLPLLLASLPQHSRPSGRLDWSQPPPMA